MSASAVPAIFLIDPNLSQQQLIVSALRSAGFLQIANLATVEDLNDDAVSSDSLEDFVFCSVTQDNLSFVQNVLSSSSAASKLRWVAIYPKELCEKMPKLFELGLLAALEQPCAGPQLESLCKSLMQKFVKRKVREAPFSVTYLAQCLNKLGRLHELNELLEGFVQEDPYNEEFWALLMEGIGLSIGEAAALSTLSRAQAFFPESDLFENVFAKLGFVMPKSQTASLAAFGVNRAVLLDADEAFVKQLAGKFQVSGAEIFGACAANEVFEKITAGFLPELIIFDWRLPGMPGPKLLQRLLSLNLARARIIVMSGFLNPGDGQLLRELGVHEVLQKPLPLDDIVAFVFEALQANFRPKSYDAFASRIRQLIANGNVETVEAELLDAPDKKSFPAGGVEILWGELLLKQQKYKEAFVKLSAALPQLTDKTRCLHMLGSCLLRMQDYASAAKMFEKANELSPLNIERMCQLADCQISLGKSDKAGEIIDKAKKIDAENSLVQSAALAVELASGKGGSLAASAAKLLKNKRAISEINNRAVAYSKSKNPQAAVNLLEGLKKMIPENTPEHPTVTFNFAVVLARLERYKEANTQLLSCKAYPAQLMGKVEQLGNYLKNAMENPEFKKMILAKTADSTLANSAASGSLPTQFDVSDLLHLASGDRKVAQRGLRGVYFA